MSTCCMQLVQLRTGSARPSGSLSRSRPCRVRGGARSAASPCRRCSTSGRRSRTRRSSTTIWASPLSHWSSSRSWCVPSTATAARWRPSGSGRSPGCAVESIRLLVKLILALIARDRAAPPRPGGAPCASDSRGGTGRCPTAATAIAVPPAIAITRPAMIASRRRVETVRRKLHHGTTFLVSC